MFTRDPTGAIGRFGMQAFSLHTQGQSSQLGPGSRLSTLFLETRIARYLSAYER